MIPHSTSDPISNIFSDQHYAPEPTFKSNGPYDCPQPPEFPPNTEKSVMTEEQEEMARKLRSVHLPFGFKMPKFKKYDGHGDTVAHLRRYYNQLRSVGGKEELLMAYFGESLSGLASEWFVDQDIDNWNRWDDLKKSTETFRDYAIRWCEQAARVKPPMKESKIVESFIQAQDETYYQHLLPALGKPFIEVLKMGEMIEDGIKTGLIVSFATLKVTTQAIQKGSGSVGGKKEEDTSAIVVRQQARERGPHHRYPQVQTQVYTQASQNLSRNPLYSIPPPSYPIYNAQPNGQLLSYPQWHVPTLQSLPQTPQTYQSPSRPDFWSKPNNEMRQKSRDSFTPIEESYVILFQRLVQQGMITPLLGYTPDPHSRSFDPNV
ncbi:hypothetical protein P3S67_021800 [Capsicum chacoense]